MSRRTKRERERELDESRWLLRAWNGWHREERDAVLAGPHGPMFERLLHILKTLQLQSAPLLLAYVRGVDWSTMDSTTRHIVLREIDAGIVRLRLASGRDAFDDALPGERTNIFLVIKDLLFPAQAAPPGAQPGLIQPEASK